MKRRDFLAALSALGCEGLRGQKPEASQAVANVHVIFKTHLDIGITDMAAKVVDRYFDAFIPEVMSITGQIAREHGEDRYIWTTGSWLIYEYLERASPEKRRRMEQAIEAGDFVWHGLPFTTHSELCDASLFRLGTRLSDRLDERFQRRTIAAKMTDVPGHTRGLVPVMAEAGLRFLHIGANPACSAPDVPPLFAWRSPDGAELLVMLHRDYGGVMLLPGGRTAVSISHTSDNVGPHSRQQIAEIYSRLRKRFPQARVFASDLNAVAREVQAVRSELPVVTQELGDTWIYGPASDPLRMAEFRELSRLRRQWIADGKLRVDGDVDVAFGKKLLQVAEHTWGLDTRTFLKHWDIYNMDAFRANRNLPEFQHMEASWNEKRAYIAQAIEALPAELARDAQRQIRSLRPVRSARNGLSGIDAAGKPHDTRNFRIGFDPETGAIRTLQSLQSGREWAGPQNLLGLFSYQTFSPADFTHYDDQYLTTKAPEAREDFGKRGLEASVAKSALYLPKLKSLRAGNHQGGHLFLAELEVPEAADSGCPREIVVETFLPSNEPSVQIVLKWFGKAASRLPEALWFSFVPSIGQSATLEMDKMGQAVSPLDVVRKGNRNLHAVIDGVRYRDAPDSFHLETRDAFLAAPGRRSLLIFDNQEPRIADGVHFCLCNNVWGQNFSMWFGDDMQFRFALKF